MIEARHLTKRYGHTVAVDEASFVVRPGRVTGFLGPNGAGKSTTMRMILGLDMPSSGSVLVNGVFLSSHLMSEMAQTADHLLVIGRGRIIADASTDEFVNRNSTPSVRVRAVEQGDLADALSRRGALLESVPGGALVVTGLDAAAIGAVACAHDIALVELATHSATLEEAFFDLTRDETDYHAGQLAGASKGI